MLHNVLVVQVRYAMCKVNKAYLSGIISHMYTCGAMQCFMWKILFLTINLHVTRHGHYTMQDLAMEACYTIDENDY